MVDLSGSPESGGPIEHGFSNWVFIVPALITGGLIGFFFYKLIQSLLDKQKKKEEKKKQKQQKKEITKKKAKSDDNLKDEPIYSISMEGLADNKSESIDLMSGEYQSRYHSSELPENNNFVPEYDSQANNPNLTNFEESGGKGVNYGEYYNYYNYYQHSKVETDFNESIETNSKPRPIDLINKALAKQHSKTSNDGNRDDDEEEGQIPSSPGIFNRSASRSPRRDSSRNSQSKRSQKSISRSPSKGRSVRSHSRSRKRHFSRSRSRSPTRRRRRTRSRSRSPYFGPIIKDYRRGRRGFVRYPRGFRDRGMRPYRRGHHSQYNYYGVSRRHEYSRSRSRSFSPKRRHIEIEKSENISDEEKTMDSKHSETLKPSDINISEKRLTQSFLAMLEEKQNRAKMIPIPHNSDNSEDHRTHGFVNTFNTVDSRKHTLSYDLEREGWQVIDDANSDSRHDRHKSREDYDYERKQKYCETGAEKEAEIESRSTDSGNKHKKKKSKKQKKKKKRKASTSSDSSDSESDNENADEIEIKSKKRSKKKKKKSKKKKRKVSSSSSSSENEEQTKKQRKKKKKKDLSSESESEDKPQYNESVVTNQKTSDTNDLLENSSPVVNEVIKENIKTKDKKKNKRKSSDSDSSDSDSDLDNKKKKKKKKKKSSKKRKHRSSSSSSSDSSDSSESVDRKKKKRKKSKKSKLKKHKKRSEKKEKSKSNNDDKKKVKEEEDSEFVSVVPIGESLSEIKWPKKLIKFTHCLPSLQYSVNPKVTTNSFDLNDSKQMAVISEFEDSHRSDSMSVKESHQLTTEYERFIDELNPNNESGVCEQSFSLESKLRDKLVKQFYDRSESQKQDFMTSSERRALEKSKKQGFHSYDSSDDFKRHEEFKSAPLSAYYSPKVQKSSPINKSNEKENIESKPNKTHEMDSHNKISLTVEDIKEDSSHKHDSKSNESSKTDDRKKTARELLERVKQRKHSDKDSKESANKDKYDSKNNKKLPQIGRMKIPSKKSLLKNNSVTTANADSTQNMFVSQPMKLDMNYDYNWYYNYYMNSVYGVGQYPQVNDPALVSAYYAHYSMVTSYDYNQNDLNNWMTERGFTFDSKSIDETQTDIKSSEQIIENNIKTEVLEPSVESSDSDPNKDVLTNDSSEQNICKQSKTEQTSDLKNDSTDDIKQNSIEVIVSTSNSELPIDESTEQKSDSPQMSPFSSSTFQHKVRVRVTADSHNQIESNDVEANQNESPPPPPPPPRPTMTTMVSTEEITLPNGQVLPPGTKQVVVHPYQTDKFTADWFCDSFNAQNNTTQTNSS